jgi:hypothetical protein
VSNGLVLLVPLSIVVVSQGCDAICAFGYTRGPAEHALELPSACLFTIGMRFLLSTNFSIPYFSVSYNFYASTTH